MDESVKIDAVVEIGINDRDGRCCIFVDLLAAKLFDKFNDVFSCSVYWRREF